MSNDNQSVEQLRHTAAHILAQAVKRLYPEVKLGIGPSTETGFYYDFDRETSFTPDDLETIQEEMKNIIDSRDRNFAGITAPACGLFLKEVKY